jgi:hypothetical protein
MHMVRRSPYCERERVQPEGRVTSGAAGDPLRDAEHAQNRLDCARERSVCGAADGVSRSAAAARKRCSSGLWVMGAAAWCSRSHGEAHDQPHRPEEA